MYYTRAVREFARSCLAFFLCSHIKFTHDYATDDSHFPSLLRCLSHACAYKQNKQIQLWLSSRRVLSAAFIVHRRRLYTLSAIKSRRRSCGAYTREFPFWDIIRSESSRAANGKYLYQEKCGCLKLLCCISFS